MAIALLLLANNVSIVWNILALTNTIIDRVNCIDSTSHTTASTAATPSA